MDVLVIGGSGLVGTTILERCRADGIDAAGTFHTNRTALSTLPLDETDADATRDLVLDREPDVVVDAAAFHAVDACESNRTGAWDANAAGTRYAAGAADEVGARFVYLSTDYVFPGRPDEAPYAEDDPVAPINYYARTKYAGEQAARIATDWTVLRTSVVYGAAGANFATWALGELEAGNRIDVVDDQVSTPTYAPDLARACLAVAAGGHAGLYHATGPDALSRYAFTRTLATIFDLDPDLVEPVTTGELGQEAARPADGSLDSTRLYETTGRRFRGPDAALCDMRDRRDG